MCASAKNVPIRFGRDLYDPTWLAARLADARRMLAKFLET